MLYGFIVVAWLIMPHKSLIIPFASMEDCQVALKIVTKEELETTSHSYGRYMKCVLSGEKRGGPRWQ